MSKSRIFLFVCLGFIAGVFVQSLARLPLVWWAGFLIAGIAGICFCWEKRKILSVFLFLICLVLGAARLEFFEIRADKSFSALNDKGSVELIGLISENPDLRSDKVLYKVAVENFFVQGKEFQSRAKILITASKYPLYQYGDRLEISAKPKEPANFDDFDYQSYLAKENIFSVAYYPKMNFVQSGQGNIIKEALFKVEKSFKKSIESNFGEPQSSLLEGLLLGEKRGFSEEFKQQLSLTGTTHIVALSGYNITIIASALLSFFGFLCLRRQTGFFLAACAIVLFVLMTGADASVVRAGVMGILVLIARQNGRLYSVKNALVFACAVMVWFNPKILVFDLGFQLSFLATLGLIYFSPFFEGWLEKIFGKTENGFLIQLKQIFCSTVAAQLAVLPLILFSFGKFSLIAPLANLVILFFIPAAMFWGFFASLAGIFWPAVAKLVAWAAWLILTGEIKAIEFFSGFPLAGFDLKIGGIFMAVSYLAIFCWLLILQKNKKVSDVAHRMV